jgi:hypothetical protein
VAVSLLAALAWSTSACTVINDLNRVQCATDTDCTQRGGSFAGTVCQASVCVAEPTWGCLGNVVWPPSSGGGRVTAKLVLSDLVTTAPLTNATARVCGKLDPDCATPVTSDLHSDADGILTVDLPKGFDGFLEINEPNMLSPTLYFFYPPLDSDRLAPYVPLVPPSAFFTLATQTSITIDVLKGAAIAIGYDCQKQTVAGLQYGIDDANETTIPFYMEKGLPSVTASESDISGQGGFVNVTPGVRTLSASVGASGAKVGKVSVIVRKSLITYTTMVPTPD